VQFNRWRFRGDPSQTLSDRGTKDNKVEDTGADTLDVTPFMSPISPQSTTPAAREVRENQFHPGIHSTDDLLRTGGVLHIGGRQVDHQQTSVRPPCVRGVAVGLGLANPGAQDTGSGSIRTTLQGSGGGAPAATGERGT
jgi:hypothetical protein